MNNKIALLLVLIITLHGCKRNSFVVFSSENFTENALESCKTIGCPEITINYLSVSSEGEVSEKINAKINKFIIEALNIGDDSIAHAATISEAATDFIKTYRLHSAEFPDMATDYFAEITVSEMFHTSDLISLSFRKYLYTGGAHGYEKLSFLNIDPQTGEEIPSEEIIKDINRFTQFAEERFREKFGIAKNENINSNGFSFENDQFHLPESIGVSKSALLLLYNQYDIASYADGPIELKIPLKDVEPFLNF
ncbi:DUF3298 and DUF4163 domain-containing protein [Ulvibacter antarcticus]|uniref:Uncharacterized protein DUF3298 n=1 Tax=Ulvibacter antarcticus TaxID=442714 RepID=A0A3L9YZZ5_9FLAO|nr:DUF3298 and DUF4163 domain-containing protein [Ulvibacter antarcticus]RMA66153.1 uncharacterized protein DUF3298 [Ulvibacter antarcticus]